MLSDYRLKHALVFSGSFVVIGYIEKRHLNIVFT